MTLCLLRPWFACDVTDCKVLQLGDIAIVAFEARITSATEVSGND